MKILYLLPFFVLNNDFKANESQKINNDFKEFDSLSPLSLNNKPTFIKILRQNIIERDGQQWVTIESYIQFDLHGGDIYIIDPFDYIIHIRDAVLQAVDKGVDYFHFIPGRGSPHWHYNKKTQQFEWIQKEPTLRPLVLITLKRMGFDIYQKDSNEGYFISPISAKNETTEEKLVKNQKSLYKLFGFNENVFEDENQEEIRNSFYIIQEKFPQMPKFCVELISLWKKNSTESLECAAKFEDYFRSQYIDFKSENIKLKLLEKENIESIIQQQKNKEEEELTKNLNYFYPIGHPVIKRLVHEHTKIDHVIDILNRIDASMKPEYYSQFEKHSIKYNFMPIISLFELSDGLQYNTRRIERCLSNPSVFQFKKAVGVINFDTKIKSDRIKKYQTEGFNKPKFLPSIVINLEHAGIEKAMKSIGRTIDAIGTGDIGEMILVFAKDNINGACKSDDVLPLIHERVSTNHYFLHVEKDRQNEEVFHFFIQPQK